MIVELLLVTVLVVVFIVSFCGLLQKIRQTYEQEQRRAELQAQGAQEQDGVYSLSEVYLNRSFNGEGVANQEGVYPGTPPPYGFCYEDEPPKYEDIMRIAIQEDNNNNSLGSRRDQNQVTIELGLQTTESET